MKNDKLLDPRPLGLRKCCGEWAVVHQFSGPGWYGIECRVNGHIHNTHLCHSLEQACREWNEREATDATQ
jgi:hypothetical protein